MVELSQYGYHKIQCFLFPCAVAPQIIEPPDNLTVVELQNATFTCLATGRPRPEIVWVRLSDMVQLHTQLAGFKIEEQEIGDWERQSNLTIMSAHLFDAGTYVCVARNELGTETEQATLTVHGEPDHKEERGPIVLNPDSPFLVEKRVWV